MFLQGIVGCEGRKITGCLGVGATSVRRNWNDEWGVGIGKVEDWTEFSFEIQMYLATPSIGRSAFYRHHEIQPTASRELFLPSKTV